MMTMTMVVLTAVYYFYDQDHYRNFIPTTLHCHYTTPGRVPTADYHHHFDGCCHFAIGTNAAIVAVKTMLELLLLIMFATTAMFTVVTYWRYALTKNAIVPTRPRACGFVASRLDNNSPFSHPRLRLASAKPEQ